jgi:hypothetical protein
LAFIRLEWFSLLDAERLQHGEEEAVAVFDRFLIDDVGELFPVKEIREVRWRSCPCRPP